MSFKKTLAIPAILLATLTVGSLSGCVSTTSSDVKTTSTAAAGSGVSLSWGSDQAITGMPTDIPYLKTYDNAKATGDEAKGSYVLTINTGSKDAKADAAKLLADAGFTDDKDVYSNSNWKVALSGNAGTVVYTIDKA
jgi:hypothetical protein